MTNETRLQTLSLDQLLASYLQSHTLRPATIRNYRAIIRKIQQEQKITLLNELTEEVIIAWRNDVLKRATATTWNNYYTHLRALLNYALKKNWLTDNELLDIPKTRLPKRKKKTIEQASLVQIIDTIDHHEERFMPKWFWKTVIKMLFFTGMRQNQLLSLKWRDINFANNDLLLSLEGSKTHREWNIPLPQGCIDDLLYLREQTERQLGPVDITNHAVFRLQLFNDRFSGYSLTKWQIEGFFKKLTKLSGTRISAHRLRHTFATLIAQSGENPDLKSLQYILGHTDIRTTMAYIEPQKKHLEQVMNQLSLGR